MILKVSMAVTHFVGEPETGTTTKEKGEDFKQILCQKQLQLFTSKNIGHSNAKIIRI